jgi:hypothetical protein
MSLLDTFRSLPTGRLKLGTLPQWMSGSKFQLPSGLVSRRSPELIPAVVTVALLMLVGVQMAIPSTVDLPQEAVVTPQRSVAALEPTGHEYPTVLAKPIFAPDRAPVILQAQTAGTLAGFEVLGTAIAGSVSAALVRDATGRIIRVKPDAILQGWRLVSIDRAQLIFDRDGERRSLAVTAAAPRAGAVNPQLAATKSTSDDHDDDSDSSSSNSNSNSNSNSDDDDE